MVKLTLNLSFIGMSLGLRLPVLWGDSESKSCDSMKKVVACTLVKNELAYLPEWIAYHHILGVDQFEIYDHGSTDGVEKLQEMYETRGKPYVKVTRGTLGQGGWLTECLHKHKDADVVGAFDVDEFFVVKDESKSECPPLKRLLAKALQGKNQVHFPAVRYSSEGQFKSFSRQVEMMGVGFSRLNSSEANRPTLNCSMFTQKPAPVKLSESSRGCLKITGKLKTITGSLLHRGPAPFIPEENYETLFKANPNCNSQEVHKKVQGWPCGHGMFKSFVRPKACNKYAVHSCSHEVEGGTVNAFEFGGHMNHYAVRTAEEACIHDGFWSGVKKAGIWEFADDSFFHLVKDDAAVKYMDQKALQAEMDSLKC